MANSTGKLLITLFDGVMEQMNKNTVFTSNTQVDSITPDRMQNASNVYWRTVEQQSPVIEGWDMTGNETGIIEQYYPLTLETPKNDFVGMRVDDLRDKGFLDRRTMASAKKLNADQNKRIADLIASTGSLYYEYSSTGYDFIAEADTIMTERQCAADMGRTFCLNPRTNQVMASDLASRDAPPMGISKSAWETGLLNPNVADFKVYRAPTYGTVAARLNATTTTVSGNVTEVPAGYTTVSGNNVNVDYRYGVIPFTAVTNFQVGDIITITSAGGTPVNALGLMDKVDTGELMTFKIIAIDSLNVTVYPKPIAADQAGITDEQAAYANISTSIDATDVISKVNVTGGQANSFWANDSICVVGGDAPLEILNEFDGMKVVSETLDSGVKLYMAYDARLDTLQARVRLFTWYGLANKDPSRNGCAVYTP